MSAPATGGERPVILLTRKLPDAVEARLQRDYAPILNPDDTLYSAEDLIRLAAGADAILPCHTEKFTAELIAALPARIKAIANFSVGVDHCDLVAARDKGIIVTNTPDVLSDATAEIAILLMLGAARRAGEGERLVRSRQWKDWSPAFMVGRQTTGKRFGVIGMGRVGRVDHHGQDGDHRTGRFRSRKNHQSPRRNAHTGRLVQRLLRRRGVFYGTPGDRYPDQRLGHSSGLVLWNLRLQTEPRPDPPHRRAVLLTAAR
ncbi:MAG TPA: hypothetical protein ENI69_10295 [Rhodospirillales bacterium]|nr:hypothetical protein [Rhodospirillales bacterium]